MNLAPSPAPTPAGQGPRLPEWVTLLAAVAFAGGASLLGIALILQVRGSPLGPLVLLSGMVLGMLLLLGSAGVLLVGIEHSISPVLRSAIAHLRAASAAPSLSGAIPPRKGEVVSYPVTLFEVFEERRDQITFAPKSHPWLSALLAFLGFAFAGGGTLVLLDAAAHTPAKQAAQRIHLPEGGRLPHPDSEWSDWAFGAVFVAVGGLMAIGGLYQGWTLCSLTVHPKKRELLRTMALRWPAWGWTRVWPSSEIESVCLDEYVTTWPGTPKLFQFLGKVEPRETSEGHVSIRLRAGKTLDCGRGAWEDAACLSANLAGLLGVPKTLRERFEVGPPPSNDTSA